MKTYLILSKNLLTAINYRTVTMKLSILKLENNCFFISKTSPEKALHKNNTFFKINKFVEIIYEEEFFGSTYEFIQRELELLIRAFKKYGFNNVRSTSLPQTTKTGAFSEYQRLTEKFSHLEFPTISIDTFKDFSKELKNTKIKKVKERKEKEEKIKKTKGKTFFIYVLELKENKYYVGVTTDIERRYTEHLRGNYRASQWTKKFKPIKILQLYKLENSKEKEAILYEDYMTELMIKKYGFENVRGGKFTQTVEINKGLISANRHSIKMSNIDESRLKLININKFIKN